MTKEVIPTRENVKLDQKGPYCFMAAIFNLLELRGHEISQAELDHYYKNFVLIRGRDAANIPDVCAFTQENPMKDGWYAEYKVLYNRNVPAYRDWKKSIGKIADTAFKRPGVLLVLKMQTPQMMPIYHGTLIINGTGYRVDENAVHAVVLKGRSQESAALWLIENSWAILPEFNIHTDTLRQLAVAIYDIQFLQKNNPT